ISRGGVARQKALRQRWPLVRWHVLSAGNPDGPRVARTGELSGNLCACLSAPDDQDVVAPRQAHSPSANHDWATCATSPSTPAETFNWHPNRLSGRQPSEVSSRSSSSAEAGWNCAAQGSPMYTWHVPHDISPPHSPMIPGTPFRTATCISDSPAL